MKELERYVYPAVFTYAAGQEIAVVFPDLDAATSGTDDADALLSARDLLGCVLHGLKEDGQEIPAPTPISAIRTAANEKAVLIDVSILCGRRIPPTRCSPIPARSCTTSASSAWR